MKKILALIAYFFLPFESGAQNDSLQIRIHETFAGASGLLTKVHAEFAQSSVFKSQRELEYWIDFKIAANLPRDLRDTLQNKIANAFVYYANYYKNKIAKKFPRECKIALYPAFEGPRRDINFDPKNFYAKQTIKIRNEEEILIIEADNVVIKKSALEVARVQIPDTRIDIALAYQLPASSYDQSVGLQNEKLSHSIHDLVNTFWSIHSEKIKQNPADAGYSYVALNEDIFRENIFKSLENNGDARGTSMFQNFLTHFLGNYNVKYYPNIPIDDTTTSHPPSSSRTQQLDPRKLENYSLGVVSASKKDYDARKALIPTFKHFTTTQNFSLREIVIAFESELFRRDIRVRFNKVYEHKPELADKFVDDILRFFYGFTTAITIQDVDRIREFYHDMAIRSFFPGQSSSLENKRVVSFGAGEIAKRFNEKLRQRDREIYMTLNEGNAKNNTPSTVWIYMQQEEKFEPKVISDIAANNDDLETLRHLPAYLMTVNTIQRWRTIRRKDQRLALNDKAEVEFTLLCLNMENLREQLNNTPEQAFDKITIFTLASYLQDLRLDMYEGEEEELKTYYKNLWNYLEENRQKTLVASASSDENERQDFFKFLSSSERFTLVIENLRKFMDDDLRSKVHNRRFLFNVCYLKILYQITRDQGDIKMSQGPESEVLLKRIKLEQK